MRFGLMVLCGALGLALLAGFGGGVHPLGDSLSLFRPVLVPLVACAGLALMIWRTRALGAVLVVLAVWGGVTLIPARPVASVPQGRTALAIYQKNLFFRVPDVAPIAEDVRASQADFVTLQELHQRNRGILSDLAGSHPTQLFCPFAGVGGTAVLSRWPAIPGQTLCAEGAGLAGLQVDTPDGPIWVLSLHLHWPYPHRQAEQLRGLLPRLQALDGPVVLGGDFNMVAWSWAAQTVERATRTTNAGPLSGTFRLTHYREGKNLIWWLPRLPIDHVLVPEEGAILGLTERPRFGSDHHGVLASFVLGADG